MGLNTYPANPFPPSTDQMDADMLEAEVSELKSGLTNVDAAVDLNTQDLTTPSRTINLMTLPITITKKLGSTGTVTNNNGVITLNGEFLQGEAISITCANCVVPNDAIIAYMNNVALPGANIAFYNGETKHDYYSFSIANRIIWTTALSTMVGKTVNKYEINFATAETLDNFTFSLMMVHDGQNVSTYVPNIPSVDSRIEAVESGLTDVDTTETLAYTYPQGATIGSHTRVIRRNNVISLTYEITPASDIGAWTSIIDLTSISDSADTFGVTVCNATDNIQSTVLGSMGSTHIGVNTTLTANKKYNIYATIII